MRVYDNGIYRDATEEELKGFLEITPEMEIQQCKEQLAATDYKVTKNAECLALGLELPYNAEELHAERQALRDRINELEAEL